MKLPKILALLLVMTLLLTGCGNMMQALAELSDRLEHRVFDDASDNGPKFSEMEYVRPDLEAYRTLLDEACYQGETSTDPETVMEAVYAMYDAYDNFVTMDFLPDIRYSIDLTDEFYQEEYEYCAEQTSFFDSSIETLYASLAQSPILETLETEDYFGPGFFDAYKAPEGSDPDWEYESVWDDTLLELSNREAELESRYYETQQEGAELDPDSQAYRNWSLENMGPILVELIQVRQEMADYLGYASAEEFITDWYYGRSVTPQELDSYAREIQTHLVPLYSQYMLQEEDPWSVLYRNPGETGCLRYVASAAENMGGVVQEAWQELTSRELYDIGASPNKANVSYEVYLVDFDAPFILLNPYEDMSDLLGFAHEFGHFANDYAIWGTYASSDVTEVLSQTMEYLSLRYSQSLSQQEQEALTQYAMSQSLSVYVYQMALYSFERQAYALKGDQLSVEGLCRLYEQIARDYGFQELEWYDSDWTTVPHFYQYPFYVYSYIVSNDAAMQIYQMELEEPGAGLELYQEFLFEWEDLPLSEYLERYDLQDPLTPGRIKELAGIFRESLELE